MNEPQQRAIDPRLLIPIVGVILVLAIAVFLFFFLGGGDDDAPSTAVGAGGQPASTAATGGTPTATAADEGELSVEEAGRLALAQIVEERAVAFEPTQGERRNNAQNRILQGGVPAAGQDIRVFAWQDEDGHVLTAVAEGGSVAGRLCGISISYLDGPTHLDGSVDVKSRPDCNAPGFYQSPIQSLHEPGTSSGDTLIHVVRSAGPLPDGAEVHIWAFVAIGEDWDNVGYTCDQECSQALASSGDPVTAEDFEREREYKERERAAYAFIRQWMEEVARAQSEQGFDLTEDGWAVALQMQGVLIPLAPPVAQ